MNSRRHQAWESFVRTALLWQERVAEENDGSRMISLEGDYERERLSDLAEGCGMYAAAVTLERIER